MATKSEIEEELNEKLDLDIEWSQLKKDDLRTIQDGLEEEEFVKKFMAQYVDNAVGGMAGEKVKGWQPGQGLKMLAAMQEGQANPADFFM